jgi:regulator of protease activity HflC (stomatin/prohibitin superfamily)
MIANSFAVVEPTEMALDYNTVSFTVDEKRVLKGGRQFIGLGHTLIKFPTLDQTIHMGTPTAASSKAKDTLTTSNLVVRTEDGLQVTLDVSFQYRLQQAAAAIVRLYKDFMNDYRPTYVRIARNVLRDVAAEFQAFNYFYNRSVISNRMKEALMVALLNHSAEVRSFQLLNYKLPTKFSDAIEKTEIARQEIVNAKYQQRVATTQANTRVEEAKRQAKIILLAADATAQETALQAVAAANVTLQTMEAEKQAYRTIKDELALDDSQLLSYVWLKAMQGRRSSSHNVIATDKPTLLEAPSTPSYQTG